MKFRNVSGAQTSRMMPIAEGEKSLTIVCLRLRDGRTDRRTEMKKKQYGVLHIVHTDA